MAVFLNQRSPPGIWLPPGSQLEPADPSCLPTSSPVACLGITGGLVWQRKPDTVSLQATPVVSIHLPRVGWGSVWLQSKALLASFWGAQWVTYPMSSSPIIRSDNQRGMKYRHLDTSTGTVSHLMFFLCNVYSFH